MAGLVVFALDGTLIDSASDIAAAVNRMRTSFGFPELPIPDIVAMTGNGVVSLVTRALAGTGGDIDEGVKRQRRFYAEHLVDSTSLYPGVAEGLAAMKAAGTHLVVFTNKPTPHAENILKTLGAAELLDIIWGGDSGFPLKPEPDALLEARKRFAVPTAQCWMLGDNYTDLEAGRRAGFRRGLASWGFGTPGSEIPDRVFGTFAEFTAAVLGEA